MSEQNDTRRKVAKRLAGQEVTVIREGYVGTHDDRLESGFCYVTGRIKTTDGVVLPAVLHISVRDRGEHWGTLVPVNGHLTHVHEGAFLEIMKERGIEVVPYSYNYDPIIEGDLHVKDQPEIRELTLKQEEKLERAVDHFEITGKAWVLGKNNEQ